MDPLSPISIHGSPVTLPKFQMAPSLILLMFSGSKKKEPRCICLNEAKASKHVKAYVLSDLRTAVIHKATHTILNLWVP
jgi:hypothetical protein